jgi:Translation initiation factor IF-3, C-terminal domain.
LAHKDIGEVVMQNFLSNLNDIVLIDKPPFWEGKWYECIVAPKKK